MRLYRTEAGKWAGTQDEARQLAGRAWSQVEVPTDKPGLLAFLNEMAAKAPRSPVERLEPDHAPPHQAEAKSTPASPAAAPASISKVQHKVQHDIKVEEEIAGADLPTTIRLADHIMWRLNEHVRSAEAFGLKIVEDPSVPPDVMRIVEG
jgi:hypothetical protein